MHWDERYAESEYAYGTEPNDFLRSVSHLLPDGPVLCLAEGQGRNAVFLAQLGYAVTAVDQSAIGLARAQELARSRAVEITTVVANLETYVITPESWGSVVSIFAHLSRDVRGRAHRAGVAGLRPGGVFVLEGYSPRQLEFGTGGPKQIDLLMQREDIERELAGLEFVVSAELEREIQEGPYHRGRSSVVQILGRKPGRAEDEESRGQAAAEMGDV